MDNNEPVDILIEEQVDTQIIVKAYPDLNALFTLFFVLLFYTLIVGAIEGVFIINTQGVHLPLLESFLTMVGYVMALLLTIRYAVKKSKKQQEASSFNFSFNKIQGWLVPLVIISTLALVVGLERVSNFIPMSDATQHFFERMIKKDPFSIITVVIAAPILEEILCRGVILKGLLKNYSPYKAILISAIFFGVIHMNPWQALPAFCGGLFLGWVFYKTQSVIPGMFIHMTINATASMFLFLPKNKQGFSELFGEPYYIILCIFSALIFISGCVLIHKKALPLLSISPNNTINY